MRLNPLDESCGENCTSMHPQEHPRKAWTSIWNHNHPIKRFILLDFSCQGDHNNVHLQQTLLLNKEPYWDRSLPSKRLTSWKKTMSNKNKTLKKTPSNSHQPTTFKWSSDYVPDNWNDAELTKQADDERYNKVSWQEKMNRSTYTVLKK